MSLLDKYDQMQSRPMGTSTALYRDPATVQAGRDYNRQKEDYGFARRLLRRYAKAGMPDMALKLAELGDKTVNKGVTTRGTSGANERNANVAGRVDLMKKGIRRMENPVGVQGASGVQGATATEAAAPVAAATPLGRRADQEFNSMTESGFPDQNRLIKFRQRLDRAIGMAKSPDEMTELQVTARKAGISDTAFKRRQNWWARR